MLFKESIISAITSIRSNIIRSFLTTLAIIIGTAAVIAVIGLGSSANKALDAQIVDKEELPNQELKTFRDLQVGNLRQVTETG